MNTGKISTDEAFIAAFDGREAARIESDMALAIGRAGSYPEAERARVELLIARDKRDRIDEQMRQIAAVEVADGVFVNLGDTVMPPTPEWLARHDCVNFTPDQQDGTVRTVRTVRRVLTPIIARLWTSGKIDEDMARACLWYRHMHEQAGLEGRWSGSQWRGPDDIRTPGGALAGHMAMTEREVAAREAYRTAHKALPQRHARFFEKVVIEDVPLRRAARFARCRNGREKALFCKVAAALVDFCDDGGYDLPPMSQLVKM